VDRLTTLKAVDPCGNFLAAWLPGGGKSRTWATVARDLIVVDGVGLRTSALPCSLAATANERRSGGQRRID